MLVAWVITALLIGQISAGPSKVSHYPLPASVPTDPLEWTNEEWRGNDQPFENVRAEIDNTNLTPDLIAKYKSEADLHPTDALSKFRWGYAYYQAWKQHIRPFSLSYPSYWMMLMGNFGPGSYHRQPLSHAYEYMRLLFLMTQGGPMPNDNAELVSLGRRLLKRTPGDFDVEYHLIFCMDTESSQTTQQEALDYAQDLVRRYPNRAEGYHAVGGVYFVRWFTHRNKGDGANAIKWLGEYLRHAQQDDPWKQQAQRNIDYIKARMNGS